MKKITYRELMEMKLNRKLTPIEIVHHVNGNHGDNRIDNLQLCDNQQEHACIHHEKDLNKWLKECRNNTFKNATNNFNRHKKPFKVGG